MSSISAKFNLNISICIIITAFFVLLLKNASHTVYAQSANCSETYQITHSFENDATWSMCWNWRAQEGIVFHDINYKSPLGISKTVLKEAALAELHVNYDHGSNWYLDVSGEGMGINMLDLGNNDCEAGTLYSHAFSVNDVRQVLCKSLHTHKYSWRDENKQASSESLELFSVSHIGEYEYIPKWVFHDNGEIEIAVGATGQLQNLTMNPSFDIFGWNVRPVDENPQYALSHTHNYWFRLDFDLDGPMNDVVEVVDFPQKELFLNVAGQGVLHQEWTEIVRTDVVTETTSVMSPENYRVWRVRDDVSVNADGHPISYRLDPTTQIIYRGTDDEFWATADLYITDFDACERLLVNNPTTDGCAANVVEYITDTQTITDPVLWYSASFHHWARNEDEPYMPIHWEGFHLVPHDWTAENEIAASAPTNVTTQGISVDSAAPPLLYWLLGLSMAFVVGTIWTRRVTGEDRQKRYIQLGIIGVSVMVSLGSVTLLSASQHNPYGAFSPPPSRVGFDPLSLDEINRAMEVTTQSQLTRSVRDHTETLQVERHREEKGLELSMRRADVYVYDYGTDETVYTLVDLETGEINHEERLQKVQLPLNANERVKVIDLMLADEYVGSLLRKIFGDSISRNSLSVTPLIIGVNGSNISDKEFEQCGVERCVRLLVSSDAGRVPFMPVVNLSTGAVSTWETIIEKP